MLGLDFKLTISVKVPFGRLRRKIPRKLRLRIRADTSRGPHLNLGPLPARASLSSGP